jgi:hypothetical protein
LALSTLPWATAAVQMQSVLLLAGEVQVGTVSLLLRTAEPEAVQRWATAAATATAVASPAPQPEEAIAICETSHRVRDTDQRTEGEKDCRANALPAEGSGGT